MAAPANMERITSCRQVSAFADCLVAYRTNSCSLGAKEFNGYGRGDGYSLASDPETLFAVVREWDNLGRRTNGGPVEEGHRIRRVLNMNAFAADIVLSDYYLEEPLFLLMRVATAAEKQELTTAVSEGKAKLERLIITQRAVEILTKALLSKDVGHSPPAAPSLDKVG